MSDTEIVDVAAASGGATIVQEGGRSESMELADARRTGQIVQLPAAPVEYIEVGPRSLSAAARERIKAIRASAAAGTAPPGAPAAAPPAAPAEKPAAAVITEDDDAEAPAQAAAAVADEDDNDPDAPPGEAEAAKPADAAKAEEKPPAVDAEVAATVERQAKMLEQHRAEAETARRELEQARAAMQQARYQDEDDYNADPAAAARRWVARALNVDEKAPEVDKELDDLLADLIAARHGVPLDAAQRAERQSVRTQRAWEAEKRRRVGHERDTAAREQNSRAAQAARQEIGRRLELFPAAPNLRTLARAIDGKEPSDVVWEALERGVRNGTIDANASDDVMFAAAVGVAEKYYASRADAFRTALNLGTASASGSPPVSQAGTAAANVKDDRARQGHGPRAITNAAASVAPATSTQKQPEPPKVRETDEERRIRITREHFARARRT